MESAASGAFSVISGVWEWLKPGEIALKTDHVRSTAHIDCDDVCVAHDATEPVLDVAVSFFGLNRARCIVFLAFEWNGCDVRNARALIGNESFVGALSGASFKVEATAGGSGFKGASKCECCKSSACVVFDITLTSDAALTFGTGRITRRYRICGDGTVTKIPTP